MKILWLNLIILFGLNLIGQAQDYDSIESFKIQYPEYFSKHDIVYKSPSYEGYEGFPMGNGDMGGMIWNTPQGIKIQINKSDAFDIANPESEVNLRSLAQFDIDFEAPVFNWLYLNEFDSRLSLYRAESSFESKTPFMDATIKSIVAANENLWIVECTLSHNGEYLGPSRLKAGLERWGSRSFSHWYSGHNSDASYGIGGAQAGTLNNMIYVTEKFGDMKIAVAAKLIGVNSNTFQINRKRSEIVSDKLDEGHFYVLISAVTSNESESPLDSALEMLDQTDLKRIETLKSEHDSWWEDFWQRSFIHLPDDYIENIYYFKRYLLASSSRGMYPALFNSAIFTWNHDVRNWVTPHHWNMQQIYWGVLPSGDSDLLLPYLNAYNRIIPFAERYAADRGAEDAILITEPHDHNGKMVGAEWSSMTNNYTPASQIAGFFWKYFKYTGDVGFLRKKGYLFMKKAASFYLQKLKWDKEKSEYYLFPCQPYEHARARELKNCTTDRVMIESLFKNCISAAGILKTDEGLIKKWTHVIDYLWDPPMAPARFFKNSEWPGFNPVSTNENNLPDTAELFALGYKPDGKVYPDSTEGGDWVFHFSANTAAAFPANLVGIDEKGSSWYKACGAAVKMHPHYRSAISPDPIVAARLGMGDESLKMIRNSIRRLQHFPQGMFYNLDHWYWFSRYADSLESPEYSAMRDYIYDKRTHYNTKGNLSGLPAGPFIQFGLEPLGSIGAAINEMLLQSNEGKIRIFPALPEDWKNEKLAFKLWAENGFLVSALRNNNGRIETFSIKSRLGNNCVFVSPWSKKEFSVKNSSGQKINVREVNKNVYSFKTIAGEEYNIYTDDMPQDETVKVFTGQVNNKPKHFKEAILGREKDF